MSPHTPKPDPLETILNGLRDATPTPGFEARLLARLESAPSAPVAAAPPRRTFLLFPVALATAAAVLLALFLPRPHTSLSVPTPIASAPVPSRPTPQPAAPARVVPVATGHHPRAVLTLAEAEAAAPSLPPPPLDLTPEERNIQRFRSLHTAVSLAALTPDAIRAHNASDQQDLHNFFDPNHQEN